VPLSGERTQMIEGVGSLGTRENGERAEKQKSGKVPHFERVSPSLGAPPEAVHRVIKFETLGSPGAPNRVHRGSVVGGPTVPDNSHSCRPLFARSPRCRVLPDGAALLAVGAGSQFGLWPCGPGQLYWFLTKNAPQDAAHDKAEAVALCRDWAAPIPEIIEGTSENAIVQNDILDRPPLRWWGRGRVTLLGDAAHATTPNLGQGACQALEDAVMLAHCLSGVQPVEAALRAYERVRIPRTTAIVRDSWQSGRILQPDRPALEWLRNRLMGTRAGRPHE
jgi:hypothetical protein